VVSFKAPPHPHHEEEAMMVTEVCKAVRVPGL
jgi:hypothetical protein